MIAALSFTASGGARAHLVVTPPVTQPDDSAGAATATPKLVLASGSPRRHELLGALGASFAVIVTDAETGDDPVPQVVRQALPAAAVPEPTHPTLLAWRKAAAAAQQAPEAVILAADTVVVIDGDVLNKPIDPDEARVMLRRLAGRFHTVYTGLCVLQPAANGARDGHGQVAGPALMVELEGGQLARCRLAVVGAEVGFSPLDEQEIADYVATGEPLDKAGAYGVQGLGGRLVREVYGSYTTVVGLPLQTTYGLLTAAGISGLADPTATYKRWLQSQGKEPLPWPPTLP